MNAGVLDALIVAILTGLAWVWLKARASGSGGGQVGGVAYTTASYTPPASSPSFFPSIGNTTPPANVAGGGGGILPQTEGAAVWLARTLWGEARGEGATGMQAVANVIMNRVASPRYPNTVEGVVLQPKQFSMWNAGDPNGAKAMAVTIADSSYRTALDIARRAIAGTLPDLTGGALHYYATSMATPPSWALSASGGVQIGNQMFLTGVA